MTLVSLSSYSIYYSSGPCWLVDVDTNYTHPVDEVTRNPSIPAWGLLVRDLLASSLLAYLHCLSAVGMPYLLITVAVWIAGKSSR
jgi:hypothetical protein